MQPLDLTYNSILKQLANNQTDLHYCYFLNPDICGECFDQIRTEIITVNIHNAIWRCEQPSRQGVEVEVRDDL